MGPRDEAAPERPLSRPVTRSQRRHRRQRSERGAALVEFAFVSIPLFTILFGTIEFGWAFFQLNEVRHAAREGVRMLAVDSEVVPDTYSATMTNGQRLAQATCEKLDDPRGMVIHITFSDIDSSGTYTVGDDVELEVSKPLDQLTRMFDVVLSTVVLRETIATRLEQSPSTGINGTTYTCP